MIVATSDGDPAVKMADGELTMFGAKPAAVQPAKAAPGAGVNRQLTVAPVLIGPPPGLQTRDDTTMV